MGLFEGKAVTGAVAPPMRRAPVRLPVRLPVLAGLAIGGIALGLGSAWWSVRPQGGFGTGAGPWRVSLLAGSAEADALTRARIAIGGLLALNRSETMYFVATQDSAGQPLRSRCRYRVEGVPPAARWWSVTAYADDYLLFADDARRYSVNGATTRLDAQGRFALRTGPQAPAAPDLAWLPTSGDRGLVLTLRVYNPAPALQAAPSSLVAPLIEAEGACR